MPVDLLSSMIIYCVDNLCIFILVNFFLLSHDFGLKSKAKVPCSPTILPFVHTEILVHGGYRD